MNTFLHVLNFEWKNLWRNHTLKVLLLVFLGAGIYGIYFGKFEIEKQNSRIAQVQKYEKEQFDSLLIWASLDTSLADNKSKHEKAISPVGVGWSKHFTYYVTHNAPPLAGLCLGQRDLYPVYYGINVTDLTRQTNVGELANPMKLLTGNFDLSYVFVFLMPLLLIALFHNIYASEKESGTLSLLQAQPIGLNSILIAKGILRLLIVWGVSALLLILGFLLQGVSLPENLGLFFQWLFVIMGYGLLWTVIMAGIVLLKKSTALSAMLGLGVWLVLTLITPALLNITVSTKAPLPNRAEITHLVRTENGKIWDAPKTYVLDQFYADYPKYAQEDTTHFNKWYYASFVLIDKEADALKDKFEAQVNHRNDWLRQWEWLAPAAMVHEQLAHLSETDRESHLKFVQSVFNYHEELKELYYQRIFDEEQFSLQDLQSLEEKL